MSFRKASAKTSLHFSVNICDPAMVSHRNSYMLTTNQPPVTPADAVIAAPFAVPRTNDRSVKAKTVTADDTSKRMAWVVQMNSVRDAKDTAAFAELFAYFGPRVKSFLMK
jgi:hypothetical protein